MWWNSRSSNNGDYDKGNTDVPSQWTDRPDLKNLRLASKFNKPNGKWIYMVAWHHCNRKWFKTMKNYLSCRTQWNLLTSLEKISTNRHPTQQLTKSCWILKISPSQDIRISNVTTRIGLYGNWNYSSKYSKKSLFMTPGIPKIIP